MLNYLKIGSLTKKTGIVGISKLFLSLNTFLINIVFAHLISKELNASYQQALVVTNLFSMIFIFGVPTSIYYFFPRLNEKEKKGFLYQSIGILISTGIIVSSVIFFLSDYIALKFNNPALSSLLKPSALYVFFLLVSSFSDSVLITQNKHKLMAILTLIFSVMHFSAVIIPVYLKYSLETMFHILSAVTAVKAVVFFIICSKFASNEPPAFSKGLLFSQLAYIIPLGLNSVIDVLSKQLDRMLVSLLFTPEQFANYHYGALEIPLIGILTGSVTAVIIPELSKFRVEENWAGFGALFRKATIKTALLIFPLFGFLMVLAPDLFVLFFTKEYLRGVPIFRIYLFMLPIRIVAFQAILFAIGKPRIVMAGALIDLAMNFSLSIIFVQPFGEEGVALGLVAATICQALLYLYVIKKSVKIDWISLIDIPAFLKLILACAVSCVPCFFITKAIQKPLTAIILSGFAYGIVYMIFLRFVYKK